MYSNGNLQKCISVGLTGNTEPTWATTVGVDTIEGGYTLNGHVTSAITWRMGRLNKELQTPARARLFSIPRYPTIALPSPITSGALPAVCDFVGAWIWKVYIHRLGPANRKNIVANQGDTGLPLPSISVELGCIRSGAFVSFGTYYTGDVLNVLWPIFTNHKLVYRASEVVDVHAVVINCGNGFSVNGTVNYPMCAAYYNDVEGLLGLIA